MEQQPPVCFSFSVVHVDAAHASFRCLHAFFACLRTWYNGMGSLNETLVSGRIKQSTLAAAAEWHTSAICWKSSGELMPSGFCKYTRNVLADLADDDSP